MTYTIKQSVEFGLWLQSLTDPKVTARIVARLDSASKGNFGDSKSVGDGVYEMRIHISPGYRLYYTRTDDTIYFFLTGGNKKTQSKDITTAKRMAENLKE